MPDPRFLDLPFFEDRHRELAAGSAQWAAGSLDAEARGGDDVDAACRTLVHRLGDAGWLRHVVPAAYGGAAADLEVRSLCLLRETFAHASGLADIAFAMQGLGSGPITLFGSEELRRAYLPRVASGKAIAAFALSEAHAGSDVRALRTTARRAGDEYLLEGSKTWISNGGIADFYVVFCRFPEAGDDRFGAFVVDADNRGLRIAERIEIGRAHV